MNADLKRIYDAAERASRDWTGEEREGFLTLTRAEAIARAVLGQIREPSPEMIAEAQAESGIDDPDQVANAIKGAIYHVILAED